jgi:transcriptional regulator with XRE-family HTH domain
MRTGCSGAMSTLLLRLRGNNIARMSSARGGGHRLPPRKRPVAEGANPTLRQRELGLRLRDLRIGRGLTVDQVAGQLECSATKISRLETAARRAIPRDVRDLCQIYGVTDQAEVAELMELARQGRQPGWWTQYSDLRLSPLIGLEQEAVAITSYSMYYVPALLQTADYARAIIRGIARRMDPRIIDERVEARIRRQQLLEKETRPSYRALLDEAVLHRLVGGSAVMPSQLDKILKHLDDETAAIQVIPFSIGAHAGADSNFDFLEFEESSLQGPVVYVEGLFTNNYQERPAEIRRYRESIDLLRDAALGIRDTAMLISQIRRSLTD